jgi:hypothetical protein
LGKSNTASLGTWQQETRAYLNKDGAEDTCWIARKREEPEEQEAGDGIVDEKQRLVEHAILAAALLLLPLSPPLLFLWTPDTPVFHPLVFPLPLHEVVVILFGFYVGLGRPIAQTEDHTAWWWVNWHAAPRRHQQR